MFTLTLLILFSHLFVVSTSKDSRPNIILILTDDQVSLGSGLLMILDRNLYFAGCRIGITAVHAQVTATYRY